MMKKIDDQKGVTLFELIVSVLVGSIVLVTLTSTLAMITSANAQMQIDSKMENESYLMAETLKHNLLTQLDKTFTVVKDDDEAFILWVDYCEIVGGQTKTCTWTDPNDAFEPHILMLDYTAGPDGTAMLTFDGEAMHGDNMHLLGDTSIEFVYNRPEETYMNTAYQYGMITIHMHMQIALSDGSLLEPKLYTTQIIFSRY
jgi:hypothetical protein